MNEGVRSISWSSRVRSGTARASGVLTGSPAYGNWFDVSGASKVTLFITYQLGSGESSNTLNIDMVTYPEGSDNAYGYSDANATLSRKQFQYTGTSEGTAYRIAVTIALHAGDRCRVMVWESGVSSNFGTAEILYAVRS